MDNTTEELIRSWSVQSCPTAEHVNMATHSGSQMYLLEGCHQPY